MTTAPTASASPKTVNAVVIERAATGSAWVRDLWAVEMRSASCRPEPMLIGDAWHSITAPKYPGEPSRCLLFRTRKLARAWCVEATVKHAKHSKDWRFRPVRVRETVKPNDKSSNPPPSVVERNK